jgi:N-methylhydantoinase A
MIIGVDVGGTFTDLVAIDEASGTIHTAKTLTTPEDPSEAILSGINELLGRTGAQPSTVGELVHGTTLVVNALIERKGAATGLLTTRGFRDVLEIGQETRFDIYDLGMRRPVPLVPRWRRKTVTERLDAKGAVIGPLDEAEAIAAAGELVAGGVEAIAVSFLHAWANPVHERRVRDLLAEKFPDIQVSISFDVAPEIREYERTSTTVANAYVRPMMARYLKRLAERIAALGLQPRLHVMLSSGGVASFEQAAATPVRLVESGAAGGAIAASYWGGLAGQRAIVAFDMGGTTAKISLIDNGRPAVVNELEVARLHRLKRGSGLPVKTPSIDVIEIGAGGGSIAQFDSLGLLQIGPESAGARPGPVCYGRGGSAPTVTDADLVLGYLDPAYFLGGAMTLRKDLAEQAIGDQIGARLGSSIVEAASHIRATIDDGMARALRVHAAERGRDVRASTLVTFGGAGPVHAYELARLLRIERILCPFGAGVASALGFVVAPKVVDDVRSHVGRLDSLDWARVNELYAEMEAASRRVLAAHGTRLAVKCERSVEIRYAGQSHEITMTLPVRRYGAADAALLARRFHAIYRRRFGHAVPGGAIETLNWRSRVVLPSSVAERALRFAAEESGEALRGRRLAFFREAGGMIECPVYRRSALPVGASFAGPALIEERESTFVVGPGGTVTIDPFRNVIVAVAPVGG